jgi:hypothetical protein
MEQQQMDEWAAGMGEIAWPWRDWLHFESSWSLTHRFRLDFLIPQDMQPAVNYTLGTPYIT